MPQIYIENLPQDATPKTIESIFGDYLGAAKRDVTLLWEDNKPYIAIIKFPDLSHLALQQIERKFQRHYFDGKILRVHAPVFD